MTFIWLMPLIYSSCTDAAQRHSIQRPISMLPMSRRPNQPGARRHIPRTGFPITLRQYTPDQINLARAQRQHRRPQHPFPPTHPSLAGLPNTKTEPDRARLNDIPVPKARTLMKAVSVHRGEGFSVRFQPNPFRPSDVERNVPRPYSRILETEIRIGLASDADWVTVEGARGALLGARKDREMHHTGAVYQRCGTWMMSPG
jgi:hypothetical protein